MHENKNMYNNNTEKFVPIYCTNTLVFGECNYFSHCMHVSLKANALVLQKLKKKLLN